MDINTILTRSIRVFSLPPEILLVITTRKNSLAKLISEQKTTNENENEVIKPTCLACGITSFKNVEQQRAHYKLDWHRFNVKRRVVSLKIGKRQYKPTTEEEFEELMGGKEKKKRKK